MRNVKEILEELNFEDFLIYLKECKTIATVVSIINKNNVYLEFLKKHTDFLNDLNIEFSIYYRVSMLYHNINSSEELPRCNYCKLLLKDKDLLKYFKKGYCYCSFKCYRKMPLTDEQRLLRSINAKKIWNNRTFEEKAEIYNKVAQTNIVKYGTKCTLNTEENKKKKKNTWLLKYGVDNPLKSLEIVNKVKNTNISKYGSTCPLKCPLIYQKSKETLYKHYLVDNPMQSPEIIKKLLENNYKKYGVYSTSGRDDVWKNML